MTPVRSPGTGRKIRLAVAECGRIAKNHFSAYILAMGCGSVSLPKECRDGIH